MAQQRQTEEERALSAAERPLLTAERPSKQSSTLLTVCPFILGEQDCLRWKLPSKLSVTC